MAQPTSVKRTLIDKANTTVVAATAGACFVVIFCLVASWTLFSQFNYQNRVIGKKNVAIKQLKEDKKALDTLKDAYDAFVNSSQNIIGGNPLGSGPQDGDNAKIVLDALPSKYDFPALTTSMEKILTSQNVSIDTLTGTDDTVNQATNETSSAPAPIAMPFTASASGSYDQIHNVLIALDRSIRPVKIGKLTISGGQDKVTLNIDAETYFQPAKVFKANKEVVK
jgi:hypothetical protein